MIKQIIPDIHGRSMSIMKAKRVKSIFLGDYWDSFHIPFTEQLEAFKEWMVLAEETDSICLVGNHDEHYIDLSTDKRCSGFQEKESILIHHLLMSYKERFKYAHYEDNILYTHAGVTDEYILKLEERFGWIDDINILVEIINSNPPINSFSSYVNKGSNSFDGPLWLRPNSYCPPPLLSNKWQVVGHTPSSKLKRYNNLIITDVERSVNIKEILWIIK